MIILAVGAHPDDIELGAGGTIARHVIEGDSVYFLVLTYGEKGGGIKEIRKSEALESAKILNVKSVIFAEIPDTRVTDGPETISKIEEVIKEIKPDRVYTHSPKDFHQDHRNAALATFSAARRVSEILSYESPFTQPSFTPQLYVEITNTINLKIQALKKFHSQYNKVYLKIDAIKGLAKFRGHQAGVKYAEAFEVLRMIKR
jgi:LmbE family N-acetylglucosaminyl deacetylase